MLKQKNLTWCSSLLVRKAMKMIIRVLLKIVNDLTGFEIKFIKVTDYNAAVEAMRADRAHIAWYGGKTYTKSRKGC